LFDLGVTSLDRSNTYEFKFNGKKIVLKLAKLKSSVENNKKRTITEKNDKALCYLVTITHFSPESLIDGSTPSSRNSHGLLSLPLGIPPIAIVEPFVPHFRKLHEHNTNQMTINNYNYHSAA